ncbi:hypothetical protein HanRHA438_Chr01g0000681 [Helianthus annuus]|nr:hypothetical protein HanRHA438_Chr01g0000681 [Helianthus annuus]
MLQTHLKENLQTTSIIQQYFTFFYFSHLTRQAVTGPGEQFGFADRHPAPAPTF